MNKTAIDFLSAHGMDTDSLDSTALISEFCKHMDAGLSGTPLSLQMIPTYVSVGSAVPQDVPTIVLDAGGTNLRAGISVFHNNQVTISDVTVGPMPGTLVPLQKQEYLNEMADLVAPLLAKAARLGFCFSFPAEITPDLDGISQGFNKEIHVANDKGMRVCRELCDTLAARGLTPPPYALINDTVAALLGGYGSVDTWAYDGYIGFILGTGVNCCYTEQNEDILKVPGLPAGGNMVINMESADFAGFPQGDFDRSFDARSVIPGNHPYEKMVSGAYFGDLAYETVRGACAEGLFSSAFVAALPDTFTTKEVGEFLLLPCAKGPISGLCATEEDREVLYTILERLTDRAAKLVAINLTAVLIQGDMGKSPLRPACIVAEGSTFHKSAVYQQKIIHYMDLYAVLEHGRHYRFITVDQANMQGAAVAALLK